MLGQGSALALTDKGSDAAQVISAAFSALQATGATTFIPWHLTYLAKAYMAAGQFPDAWRCIREALAAIKNTKDKWFEAEFIGWQANSRWPRRSQKLRKRKRILSARSPSRVNNKPNPGTPRRNEPRAALARSGQAAASARTACSGLRLAH